MRNDDKVYCESADYMVRAVHGKCGYAPKAGSKSMMFSTFIPISQEAFALLYKNGYNNYSGCTIMQLPDDTDADTEGESQAICTPAQELRKALHSLPEMGWSTEGMQEFNALYAK
jgi:hypothetical protein